MLKELMEFPETMPLFFKHLKKLGYSPQLLYKYVKNGWLKKIGPQVYQRNSGKNIDPLLVIKAFQEHLELPVHLGAQTALYLQGTRHYLKFNFKYILFMSSYTRITRWIKSLPEIEILVKKLFIPDSKDSLIIQNGIKVSSPERALIEMCAILPQKATFDELIHLMDLSPSLRSMTLQNLLSNCVSVKAKRLFLYAAEKSNHAWFSRLDVSKIDLGKGTRQIVLGGVYDKKYDICIPGEQDG
jgi:hypothetical protein